MKVELLPTWNSEAGYNTGKSLWNFREKSYEVPRCRILKGTFITSFMCVGVSNKDVIKGSRNRNKIYFDFVISKLAYVQYITIK